MTTLLSSLNDVSDNYYRPSPDLITLVKIGRPSFSEHDIIHNITSNIIGFFNTVSRASPNYSLFCLTINGHFTQEVEDCILFRMPSIKPHATQFFALLYRDLMQIVQENLFIHASFALIWQNEQLFLTSYLKKTNQKESSWEHSDIYIL